MDQDTSQQDASDPLGSIESAVVHAKHSHGLKMNLQQVTGEATLLVPPYTNMAEGNVVTVHWDSPVEGASHSFEHTVTRDEVGSLLIFNLDHEILAASLGRAVSVSYTAIINTRERYSEVQDLEVVNEYLDPPEYLAPPTLDDMPPGEVHPQPGGVSVNIWFDDIQPGDGVVLYVDSPSSSLELWHEVKEGDLDEGFTFTLEESFLQDNLGEQIELLYAFARPGTALSAQPLILDVTEEDVSEPLDPVVHVKEAIGLTLYLKDLRSDWQVTVLPSYSMAEQDRLLLYLWDVAGDVPIGPPVEHEVTPDEVGSPLSFKLPRSLLVKDSQVDVYYSVQPKEGNERHSEHQQFKVVDAKSDPVEHLPVPTVEGVVESAIYPTPAKVIVPIAPGMELDDKVVLYVEGLEQTPPQWLSVHDTEADLEFELDVELLKFNAGDFIRLKYQYARQGAAASSKTLTLDVLHYPDAVQKSLVHIRESHALTVALSTFRGDAALSVLPYWGMAKGDEISVVTKQSGALEASALTHVVGDDDLGRAITFTLDRSLLEAAVGQQLHVGYTVVSKGTGQLAKSIVQAFSIREQETEVPPRLTLPQVEGEQDGALDPLEPGAKVSITVGPEIQVGDELILHAQSAWSLAPLALRITDDHVKAGKVDFLLPGEWLRRNASWPLTLMYQVSRARYGSNSELLRLHILEQSGAQQSGPVVHIRQAHDRALDLQTFTGNANLVILPYINMAAGQKLQIYWAEDNLAEPKPAVEHILTQEDVNQTLELQLPRDLLENALGGDAHWLYYRVFYGERPNDSMHQAIRVISDQEPVTPPLPPVTVEVLHPTSDDTSIELALYEGATLDDEIVLYTDGLNRGRPQGQVVTQDTLANKHVVFHLSEAFLTANLGEKIGLQYQYGRPGAAFSSDAKQVSVTQKPALLPGHVVHFKQAHGLTVVLEDFEGDGDLVVLPYPDMRAEQTISVYWHPAEEAALSAPPALTHVVTKAEVGNPIAFKLPRSYLQPTPPATAFLTSVHFTVHTGTGEPRIGDMQAMVIALTPPADLPARLPPASVEGAQDNKLELDLKGVTVSVAKYEGMAFADEVLFYIDGDSPVPVQWQRVEDSSVKTFEFQLSYALLKDHVGTFLDLNYQFGRPGQALSGPVRRLHIAWRAGAIAQSLVHCKESHDLTIDLKTLGDDVLLTILPYLGMAVDDQVTAVWTPYKGGAPLPSFPIPFTVLAEDLYKPITLALHRDQVAKALGDTGTLYFEVKQGGAATSVRSTEQTFKVVDDASSLPPRLNVPDVEGSVKGELMPDPMGAKVTVAAYAGMTRDDELVLHMDASRPVAPLTVRIEQRHVLARKVDLQLPGNWLLRNAESTVNLQYQYARKANSLSSTPLPLKLLKPETPIVPGPVVHFGQAQGLTVALQAFEGEGTLYVMPHDEILEGDTVTVRWQRMLDGEPIEEAWREKPSLDSSTGIRTLLIDRSRLEEAVGYVVKLDYTVTAKDESGAKFTSRVQHFRISYNPPPPADHLPQPTVESAVNGALYPGEDDVKVIIPAYDGMFDEDEVLLQASGGEAGGKEEIQWRRVGQDQHYLIFKLSVAFITQHVGKAFSLHYAWARSGRAQTARKLTLHVLQPLNLPKPILLEASNDTLAPEDVRAGGTFSLNVPEFAKIGLIQLRLLNKQVVIFESAAQRIADNEDLLFYIPQEHFVPLIGKAFSAHYLFTNIAGQSMQSDETLITCSTLKQEQLPWLQCDNARGRAELAKTRVGNGPLSFSLAGWPFMAANQNVRIVANAINDETGKREDFLLCDRPITSTEEANWLFKYSVYNAELLDKARVNHLIQFQAHLSLDAKETEISLTPIDLTYRDT